uniref:PGG domain-containing protein n=1 Tax=Chenopodium quinoa TaxID=63459 RepID=A0A803M9Z5_CHEQI
MENTEIVVVEMEKELYIAAKKGNVEFLEQVKCDDEYLRRKTHDKNNIFHVAIRHEKIEFVEACLRKFPNEIELICQKNNKGNTPLHVAAEVGNFGVVDLIYNYLEERIKVKGQGYGGEKSWRVKNLRGNTPLHVALIHDNVNIAMFLLEKDPYLARIVNNSKEAPLHLAIKQQVYYSESKSIMASIRQSINEGGGGALTIKSAPEKDMSEMIKSLVEEASYVTCWLDAEGLTPLHRVASLAAPHNIQLTKFILEHCPHSAEICDKNGKSILHLLINKIPNYQEAKNLFSHEEIYALRNYQDNQGNAPLHIAAKNMDKNVMRVLLESSTKLYIYNTEGVSAASLIQQEDMLQLLWRRKLTVDEMNAADKANIPFLREKMENLGIDFLLSQGPKGRNIIHRMMVFKKNSPLKPDLFVNFIEEALGKFPSIITQTDGKGDTPIHVLVQNHSDTAIKVPPRVEDNAQYNNSSDGNPSNTKNYVVSSLWESGLMPSLLEKCHRRILKFDYEASVKGSIESPWLLQNMEGNTALQEAIKSKNSIELVKLLLKYNSNSLSAINNNKETPLHLFASHPIEQITQEDLDEMVGTNYEAAKSKDEDGLTPLLRAFKAGNYKVAAMLCYASPKAAEIGDSNNDQTYGHLLVKDQPERYFSRLFQDKELRDERKSSKDENQWLLNLLEISNAAGVTPGDLIGELPNLPNNIEKFITNDTRMMGIRSAWGIPKKQLNSYMNSMNVIAALLTTITFTAAFQVPGGLIQDKGTPQMIGDIAFQVFMIADVLAMCLSMMVLFCLLWIMATNNKRNSVMIQDFSVSLLIVAFFATLLAFMTGVYATTYNVKRWIAIATLIICSLLLVLVQRCIVLKLFIPISKAILIFDRMVLYPATKAFVERVKSNVSSFRGRKVPDIESSVK